MIDIVFIEDELTVGEKVEITVNKTKISTITISTPKEIKSQNDVIHAFPTLYTVDKLNRKRFWIIFGDEDKIFRLAGICGEEYKVQTFPPIIVTQKNIGKNNETSLFQQAMFEANGKWKKQTDKGYVKEGEKGAEKVKDISKEQTQSFRKINNECFCFDMITF